MVPPPTQFEAPSAVVDDGTLWGDCSSAWSGTPAQIFIVLCAGIGWTVQGTVVNNTPSSRICSTNVDCGTVLDEATGILPAGPEVEVVGFPECVGGDWALLMKCRVIEYALIE